MRGELMLGEGLLARDGGRADVEHELDSGLPQGADEGGDARAGIADAQIALGGMDMVLPHAL
jgi:hypothetical protein